MEQAPSTAFGHCIISPYSTVISSMKHFTHFVGVDISAKFFTVSIYTSTRTVLATGEEFDNTADGYTRCLHWLTKHGATSSTTAICLEATGVYGEGFCYAFTSYGFSVAVESPVKVKRAFTQRTHKTDAVDSSQIAEYAFRFVDELHFWTPQSEILEQIRTLLTAREHCVKQSAATQHALSSLKHKYIQTPSALNAYKRLLEQQKESINIIEHELKRLCQSDDSFRTMIALLCSIPGVGFLMSVHLLTISNGFTRPLVARELASFCGIAPLQHQSGSSVYRKPRSIGSGHPTLRKLLYLAALSVRTHHRPLQLYFFRKVAEGKSKRLVINNLSNKLLKIICAVANSQKPYIYNYRSVNPVLFSA